MIRKSGLVAIASLLFVPVLLLLGAIPALAQGASLPPEAGSDGPLSVNLNWWLVNGPMYEDSAQITMTNTAAGEVLTVTSVELNGQPVQLFNQFGQGTSLCGGTVLDPGQSENCYFFTAPQVEGINNWALTVSATSDNGSTYSVTFDLTHTYDPLLIIQTSLEGSPSAIDDPFSPLYAVGDEVVYVISVTPEPGYFSEPTDLTFSDPRLQYVSGDTNGDGRVALDPFSPLLSETWYYELTTTAAIGSTELDAVLSYYYDSVLVAGESVGPLSSRISTSYNLAPTISTFVVSPDGTAYPADDPTNPPSVEIGSTITIRYEVLSHTDPIGIISFTDDLYSPVFVSESGQQNDQIEQGETWTYEFQTTVEPGLSSSTATLEGFHGQLTFDLTRSVSFQGVEPPSTTTTLPTTSTSNAGVTTTLPTSTTSPDASVAGTGTLPATGSSTSTMVGLALALIASGALLIRFRNTETS